MLIPTDSRISSARIGRWSTCLCFASLSSPAFGIQCGEKFDALDVNGSGVLEPEQLIPIIVELSHGHKWALTEEHVLSFTALFDVKQNNVIERDEFRERAAVT